MNFSDPTWVDWLVIILPLPSLAFLVLVRRGESLMDRCDVE